MDITKLDENFKQGRLGGIFDYYSPADMPMRLEGFPWKGKDDEYCRLPLDWKEIFRLPLIELAECTAGGCVRFRTNSGKLALQVKMGLQCNLGHMPRSGEAGFDLYVKEKGYHLLENFRPEFKEDKIETELDLPSRGKLTEYILYFPLYAGVRAIEIGLTRGSKVLPPSEHKIEKPVLFYGSSITQGGCASRPGSCYPAIVCRALEAPMVNLGFSGQAKGDLSLAKLIGSLSLSAFVLDYDHNAPSVEVLEQTHLPFFEVFRSIQPVTPVVMVSRPFSKTEELEMTKKRRQIIMRTYRHAQEQGDKHVYFVDGMEFFKDIPMGEATVDRCHPTDLGFYFMAKKILPILRRAISEAE